MVFAKTVRTIIILVKHMDTIPVRAAAEWFGGYAGGSFGLWFRGWGGNAIAGPPGAMVCGFTLGLGGAWGGATLGGNLVDCIYRTNDLIIP